MRYLVKKYKDCVEYYYNGRLHREDGPARVCWGKTRIFKAWYFEGRLHRIGGPAVEWNNGALGWYVHGELHREDGPAFIDNEIEEYWLKGKLIDKEKWERQVEGYEEYEVDSEYGIELAKYMKVKRK